MTIIAATGGGGRWMQPSSESNALYNSNFDQDNYPVWSTFNGVNFAQSSTNRNGEQKGIAGWYHYSPMFNNGWQSFVGNNFLVQNAYHQGDTSAADGAGVFADAGYNGGYNPRIIKMYGSESLFTYNDAYSPAWRTNDVINRHDATEGPFRNNIGIMPRVVSNTSNDNITSTTSQNNTDMWTRHEYQQFLTVPGSATTCKFGCYIRVHPEDKLKLHNMGGLYCFEDTYQTTNKRVVNYFRIRHNSNTATWPTGTLTGKLANYNWNGYQMGQPPTGTQAYYFTPEITVATEHAVLNQDDYGNFEKVEYTFTLQTGTGPHGSGNRLLGLGMFFAEAMTYQKTAAGTPSGSVHFFDPFVEFSS